MSHTLDATTQGGLYQELLDHDSRTVPDVLRWNTPMPGDDALRVPVRRYTDPEYHRLEVERVWKRVWQMACREEDIPEVGDHVNYEIAGMDVIIVRNEGGVIKAFRNVCMHRGRKLKEFNGRDEELRCQIRDGSPDRDAADTVMPAEQILGRQHVTWLELALRNTCQQVLAHQFVQAG